MSAGLQLQTPRVIGNRTIIPVVAEASACYPGGMYGSVTPVALIIGENDTWGIALIEGDSVAALLEKIILPP